MRFPLSHFQALYTFRRGAAKSTKATLIVGQCPRRFAHDIEAPARCRDYDIVLTDPLLGGNSLSGDKNQVVEDQSFIRDVACPKHRQIAGLRS
jgi:hypothetical protein